MKKYFINTLVLVLFLLIASCKKEAAQIVSKRTAKEFIVKSEDVLPLLKADFSDNTLRSFYKELDENSLRQLAHELKENKGLRDYLKKKPEAITTWKFLSNSNYAQKVNAIKYFDNLPSDRFLLKNQKNSAEIYEASSGVMLARVEKDAIIITKFSDNAFANLNTFLPNSIYKVKNSSYHIDDFGRVLSVKVPLLKLNNTIPSNSLGENLMISPIFGGNNLKLNTALPNNDVFAELNREWANTVKRRGKISSVNIKKIYSSNKKVPEGFNVVYYNGKNRKVGHIKNLTKEAYSNTFKKIQRSASGTYINGATAFKKFPKEITLVENKIFYNNKSFGSIDPKNKVINIDRRAALTKNNVNPFLDHPRLLPDYKYVVQDGVNEHIFITDDLERVIYSEHRLLAKYSKNRNVVSQNNAKLYGDEISSKTSLNGLTNGQHRKLSDEGGHYLADSAGGIPESINITSQAYRVNHSQKWRSMENEISSALEKGENVFVKNRQLYDNSSRRPSGSIYEVIINGKRKEFSFDNINYSLEDI